MHKWFLERERGRDKIRVNDWRNTNKCVRPWPSPTPATQYTPKEVAIINLIQKSLSITWKDKLCLKTHLPWTFSHLLENEKVIDEVSLNSFSGIWCYPQLKL